MKFFNPIIKLAFIIIICGIGLTSCNDSSTNPANTTPESGSLIGTWDLIEATSKTGGLTYSMPQEEIEADPLTYILNEDSTGIQYYQEETIEFQWITDGNTLIFSSNYGTNTYSYTVTSENLKLTFPIEEFMITHTFSRR